MELLSSNVVTEVTFIEGDFDPISTETDNIYSCIETLESITQNHINHFNYDLDIQTSSKQHQCEPACPVSMSHKVISFQSYYYLETQI